jgi:hypothetical protein
MKNRPDIRHMDITVRRNIPCMNLPECAKANLLDLGSYPEKEEFIGFDTLDN